MLNNLGKNVTEEIGLVTPTPGLVEAYLQFRIRYFFLLNYFPTLPAPITQDVSTSAQPLFNYGGLGYSLQTMSISCLRLVFGSWKYLVSRCSLAMNLHLFCIKRYIPSLLGQYEISFRALNLTRSSSVKLYVTNPILITDSVFFLFSLNLFFYSHLHWNLVHVIHCSLW